MYDNQHNVSLDSLIENLDLVDEHPHQIEWLMREGTYFQRNSKNQYKMCDLLLGYHGGEIATALELKRSPRGREKAIEQLDNGAYLLDRFGYSIIEKKIVYYQTNFFRYEIIS